MQIFLFFIGSFFLCRFISMVVCCDWFVVFCWVDFYGVVYLVGYCSYWFVFYLVRFCWVLFLFLVLFSVVLFIFGLIIYGFASSGILLNSVEFLLMVVLLWVVMSCGAFCCCVVSLYGLF